MDYAYPLYHALASISVPSDRARAVVDAMERDMGTTLATKEDLRLLEQQLASGRTELRQAFDSVRSDIMKDLQAFRSDLRKDMDALLHSITLRFGVMLAVWAVVTISVTLGALRLWL